jgi:hypothetical protein
VDLGARTALRLLSRYSTVWRHGSDYVGSIPYERMASINILAVTKRQIKRSETKVSYRTANRKAHSHKVRSRKVSGQVGDDLVGKVPSDVTRLNVSPWLPRSIGQGSLRCIVGRLDSPAANVCGARSCRHDKKTKNLPTRRLKHRVGRTPGRRAGV